ncbi:MAG: hypothetical protein WCJ94_03390 [bacterium]
MKLSKILITALFMLIFSSIFAYIPENTEENQFVPKILGKSAEVSKLVDDGIKAVRQEVVSSTYKTNNQGSLIKDRNSPKLVEENTTTTEVLYYEPKEEIYEARVVMDELLLWLTLYKTASAEDLITYKKIKGYIETKSKTLDKIIYSLKYQKDNKDYIMKHKFDLKKCDKDIERYKTRLKGKIQLISGKPLPEPTQEK